MPVAEQRILRRCIIMSPMGAADVAALCIVYPELRK